MPSEEQSGRRSAGPLRQQLGAVQSNATAVSHSRTEAVPWFWKHLMEGRYGISDLAGWGWLLGFQEPRSREHSRALQKQTLTHGQAKLTAPTSEGTAMSSLGLYYSYTVQLTCLKIPLRASLCWQRKSKTGTGLVKENLDSHPACVTD